MKDNRVEWVVNSLYMLVICNCETGSVIPSVHSGVQVSFSKVCFISVSLARDGVKWNICVSI